MRMVSRLFGRRSRPTTARVEPVTEGLLAAAGLSPDMYDGDESASPLPLLSEQHRQALSRAFTPTRPQRSPKRFAGRHAELERTLRALLDERAHVVLYGERGRGKTSLVNMVAVAARSSGYVVGRYSCNTDSDFDEIMRGLARDLPGSLLAAPAVDEPALEGCEAGLPAGRLLPRDVAALPGRLSGRQLVLIVDEFDRVLDQPTRTRLADTIKQVSDSAAGIGFLIVGVSDSLDELLGRHPSIQRNVVGIAIPLLPDAEVDEILDQGAREAGFDFPAPVRARITTVCRGVPYMAQLLALHAGGAALRRGSTVVEVADLRVAIAQAIAEADPRLVALYEQLTDGGRDVTLATALAEVAGGEQDSFARFRARPLGEVVRVAGAPLASATWRRLLDAGVLRPTPSAGSDVFTFTDPLLPHYVLLRAALGPTA